MNNYQEKCNEVNRKESRTEKVLAISKEVEEISYEVLSEIKDKKVLYFGQTPEKEPIGITGTSGIPNSGIIDKITTSFNAIMGNLKEISDIINLF